MERMRLCVGTLLLLFGVIACGRIESAPAPAANQPSLVLTLTETVSSTPAPTAARSPWPTPVAPPGYEVKTVAPAPTHTGTPTPSPAASATPSPTHTGTPTSSPTASVTPAPPSPTPTETVPPPPASATSVPGPEGVDESGQTPYRYHPLGPAQPDLSQPCPGCPRAPGYITGRVVDAGGNPLPGVRLACYNDWHRYPVVGSKGGGEYDFPILQAEATWYVVVLDEADRPLSPEAPVHFNPLEACWYRLDWQRID
jgi:hypothetical protein